MTGGTATPASDRGMSTVVSHVLSVGITTLLIISLVATASGFLEEQKIRAAGEELETIGQRLASDLEQADRLGRQGDDVRVEATVPESIAGSTYSVRLLHDPAAGSGDCGAFSTTKTCLRLVATQYDRSTLVPVYNETALSLESGTGGQYTITSAGGGDTVQLSRRGLELSPRVGIGQSVGSGPEFAGGAALSQTPIPDFTISPGIPTTDTTVTLDAGDSTDADGSIATYEWDLDGDGSFEETGVTELHTFSNAGSHNVTLRVTDNSGLAASLTSEIQISGLEYVTGSLEPIPGNDEGIRFEMRNRHSVAIEIERIMIDPADDSLDELSEASPGISCHPLGCFFGSEEDSGDPHEIEIDTPSDSGYVDWDAADSESLEIPEAGVIVDIEEPKAEDHTGNVDLGPTQDATIALQNFPASASGETFTVGVRYRVNSTVGSTAITDSTS